MSGMNPRRRFVAQLSAAVAAITGGTMLAGAQGTGHSQGATTGGQHGDSPHDEWMKKLTGHHKQFFHGMAASDIVNLMAANYLDAYTQAYGMRPEHVNAVVGVHGPALSIVMNDAVWQKFGLGRMVNVNDPATSQPSTRNVFAGASGIGVSALQERGVLFLACDTAMRLSAARWAPAVNQTAEATHEELRANLLPGVVPVPALVVAIARAQEKGFTYVRAN